MYVVELSGHAPPLTPTLKLNVIIAPYCVIPTPDSRNLDAFAIFTSAYEEWMFYHPPHTHPLDKTDKNF